MANALLSEQSFQEVAAEHLSWSVDIERGNQLHGIARDEDTVPDETFNQCLRLEVQAPQVGEAPVVVSMSFVA